MGKFGYHVIDADGHGGDLPDWQERLPKEFARPLGGAEGEDREAVREPRRRRREGDEGQGARRRRRSGPGMTDPKARIEDMDLEGIDQTVMFPGGAGEEWAGLDRGFAVALCRTLNDARAEFLRYDPKRLKSVAKLPMIDPEAAAAELSAA